MKDIFILGICSYSHEASCALLRNGEILYVIEEERLNREKHTWKFPENAIRMCLERSGLTIDDIHCFTFFMKPYLEVTGNIAHGVRYLPQSLNLLRSKFGGGANLSFFERMKLCLSVGDEIKRVFKPRRAPEVKFIEHHLAHASSCFHVSPFKEAAILTLDGRGESTTTLLAKGEGQHIHKLQEVPVPHSLGHLYAAVTAHLGFTPFFDEWKVMGMSAYGTSSVMDQFREIVRLSDRKLFQLDLSFLKFHTHGYGNWVSEKFIQAFGPARAKEGKLEQTHFDLAFALQKTVEDTGVFLAQKLYERFPSDNLCLAGGVALNVLMNRRIMLETPFKNVFIQPLANDAGTSLGSALYYYHETLKRSRNVVFDSPYLGPSYSSEVIETSLRRHGVKFERTTEPHVVGAKAVAEGQILGWFQGAMEAGPRALGNRSIVADPRKADMKDRLNLRVKKREFFRPFAPSVLEEQADEFFDLPKNLKSPYMIFAGLVRGHMKDKIPAVTHADGTARVHTVSKKTNERYWNLIHEFYILTGIPVVLNTSFNENEPIVCNPDEAIQCFLRTDFDILIIGDFVARKEAQ